MPRKSVGLFVPEVSSLAGRVCAITGSTQGIGRATALALADCGAHLLLLCRDTEKGEALAREIVARGGQASVIPVDLASLSQVSRAVRAVDDAVPELHLLINNAGVISPRRELTEDGFERMFGVNYLAPFLLTTGLLPALRRADHARIIHVVSGSYTLARRYDFDDYNWERRPFRYSQAYAQSKLACVLFNGALADVLRDSSVTSYAADPGVVATGIADVSGFLKLIGRVFKPFMQTAEQGARTTLALACDPSIADNSGGYYRDCCPVAVRPWAEDRVAARRLWELSEALLGERGFLLAQLAGFSQKITAY